jgi:putative tryptophan/tyrosine transport system substrate-binding protein
VAIPVIGFLSQAVPETDAMRLTGLRRGLNEAGYVEGRNLTIEHRWARNRLDQLPKLAAELVQDRVAVIIAPGLVSTRAAKTVTLTVPIVFVVGEHPAHLGLVASLNRPGGNLTGINVFSGELAAKGLEVLSPAMASVGFLVNPSNPGVESRPRWRQKAPRQRARLPRLAKAGCLCAGANLTNSFLGRTENACCSILAEKAPGAWLRHKENRDRCR